MRHSNICGSWRGTTACQSAHDSAVKTTLIDWRPRSCTVRKFRLGTYCQSSRDGSQRTGVQEIPQRQNWREQWERDMREIDRQRRINPEPWGREGWGSPQPQPSTPQFTPPPPKPPLRDNTSRRVGQLEGSRREVLWSIVAVALTTVGFTTAFHKFKPAPSPLQTSDDEWSMGQQGSRAMPPAVMYKGGYVFVRRYSDGKIMQVRAASAPGVLVLRDPELPMAFVLKLQDFPTKIDIDNKPLMGFIFGSPDWETHMEGIYFPEMAARMPQFSQQ